MVVNIGLWVMMHFLILALICFICYAFMGNKFINIKNYTFVFIIFAPSLHPLEKASTISLLAHSCRTFIGFNVRIGRPV